jgi:saccharopine dehydrogenase-like NADP-dependent oxidoreductase
MSKHVLLFGAGKSSVHLIDYLLKECELNNWSLTVADSNLRTLQSRVSATSHLRAYLLDVSNTEARVALVREADLVISLLPPFLHFMIAEDCLKYGKDLLTASYVDMLVEALKPEIKHRGILFLFEMGLDPGIDHMSALRLIHRIKAEGGKIISFKSHCGGLVAPESDDNPMHYKISWNPRNIVMAGSAGASFKQHNDFFHVSYEDLFQNCSEISVDGIGNLAYYPNRNSLAYMKTYELEDAETFMRTTLRHPAFCTAWSKIVAAGLTDDTEQVNETALTFNKWSQPILPYVTAANRHQFEFLGLFDDLPVPATLRSSADILRFLMETRMMMSPADKDLVVMVHQVEFLLDGKKQKTTSSLVIKGKDHIHTAMSRTVGLPLGIAARLILREEIALTGLHLPVLPQIYNPVLAALEEEGIKFDEITS